MKKIAFLFLSSFLLLFGCSGKSSTPLKLGPEMVKLDLGLVPYPWSVPKIISRNLLVQTPNNGYSISAQNNGARSQALVYYKPDSGQKTIFMAVYYFPVNSFLAANRADQPPNYGIKVIQEKT